MPLTKLALLSISAIAVTGCAGTTPVVSVSGLKGILGEDLKTARGLTREDDRKINNTLERGTAVGIWERPAQ